MAAEASRSRTPSTELEGVLLDAAAGLLEADGPDALSIRRIAKAAGVAPMGVYSRFSSKAGIVEALFIRGFERLRRAMDEANEIADAKAALLHSGELYRRLALEHPGDYRLMFMGAVPGFEASAEAKEVAISSLASLVAIVERAMREGAIAEQDPLEAAQVVWATCHGWASLEIMGLGMVADLDAGARRLRTLIVAALGER